MFTATVANETTMIDVAGKSTQLMRGGDGPPLLYLHSAGSETDWMPFHDDLAKHFTVYAPAHPGFAMSKGLDQVNHISDMAWHYVDMLAELGLERVPVVGFSLGAWIGTELALLRPHLVERLVLTAAAGLHLDDAPMTELFIDDFEESRDLVFFDRDDPSVEMAMPLSIDDPRILQWMRAREATARVGWNPYLNNPKLPEQLHRVSCPTHVIWGRHDKLIPLPHGEFYASHIPGAKLTVFDDCGHMAPFEQREAFVQTVVDFLSA